MTGAVGAAPDPDRLPPAGSAPHVVLDDIEALDVDPHTWHHLTRVRRTPPGSSCTATDGVGRWRWCTVGDDHGLVAAGEVIEAPRPTPNITIAFALTKGDKPEVTVQKLTELGIDRIVPFRAARSVVRWDEAKAASQHRRWVEIARQAVAQSHGCWMPTVEAVTTLRDLATEGAQRVDRFGEAPSLARSVLAVGPEGGWDDAERDLIPGATGLGAQVLRAETAALTAGGIMTALRSGLVVERPQSGHAQ